MEALTNLVMEGWQLVARGPVRLDHWRGSAFEYAHNFTPSGAGTNPLQLAVILLLRATVPGVSEVPRIMLMPVARLDCPVCRSAGLVFAFKSHSARDRCLCGRCGLVWISTDAITVAKLDAEMVSPPQHESPPADRSTSEGWPTRRLTVIGTYTYTN